MLWFQRVLLTVIQPQVLRAEHQSGWRVLEVLHLSYFVTFICISGVCMCEREQETLERMVSGLGTSF